VGIVRLNSVRAFIAIDLSESIRKELASLIERLEQEAGSRAVRWGRPEGIHLTLKFMGEVQAERVKAFEGMLHSRAGGQRAFGLEVGGLGCFPDMSRPRVVWAGVNESTGRLADLQEALEVGCAELGLAREARPFTPHLTLGRVRREARGDDLSMLKRAVEGLKETRCGEMAVAEVCLFRSELRPGGAVYTRLAVANLAAAT
jgi:2'-5' RNA ligase